MGLPPVVPFVPSNRRRRGEAGYITGHRNSISLQTLEPCMRPLVQAVAFCAPATAVMSACAGNQHYTPVELDHPRSATVFSSRRLDDAGPLAFFKGPGAQSIRAGGAPRHLAPAALDT